MAEAAPFTNLTFIMPGNINTALDADTLAAVRRAKSFGSKVILDYRAPGSIAMATAERSARTGATS